ncbi:MAG: Smr/MutS family protein [Alphaproteobacteria bacterium]|nr:Smr/MutS family protein [Alphaproteobacteria bacterium]
MAGKKPPRDDDAALWQAITDSVTPLKDRNSARRFAPESQVDPTAKPRLKAEMKAHAAFNAPPIKAPPIPRPPPPDLSIGAAPGLDKRTAGRLKRGKLPIEARFDLHGHTQQTGERALKSFIARSYERELRCVLVITGKGSGVLQAAAPRWLNQADIRSKIVSIQHAQPRDGGTGALYVLLKRKR